MSPNYDTNYIQAVANYVDNGTEFETTISFVDYKVTTASGIFNGFKNVRVNFYNDGFPPGYTGTTSLGPVRVMTITQ
jgi:hypothetical protein